MQILPVVMDKNYNRIAVIDSYKTLIWTTRYYTHGDFEISIGLSAEMVRILAIGNYIVRDDDDNVGIIEKVDVKITSTNEQLLIVSGRFLTQILARRIIADQTQVSSTISQAIDTLITDAIINPAVTARKIDNFVLDTYSFTDTIEAQYTGKNLFEVISDLCLQYGLGLKIYFDSSKNFVFKLYKGIDRSIDQDVNPHLIFSNDYDNLINAEYQRDSENLITAVLAAGEGEGDERKTIWAYGDTEPEGLDRYEYYDDSRNTSSNDGEISEQDYYKQLQEDGRSDLTTYETTFAGEVNFNTVKYKVDVDIGDICTIENTDLGINFNARIIEVIESIDATGKYTIIPTFGT